MSCDFLPHDLRFLLDAFERISAISSIDGLNEDLLSILSEGVEADSITGALRCNGEVLDFASSFAPGKLSINAPMAVDMGPEATEGPAERGSRASIVVRPSPNSGTESTVVRSNEDAIQVGPPGTSEGTFSGEENVLTGYNLFCEITVEDWRLVLHLFRKKSAFNLRERALVNRLEPLIKQTLRSLLLVRKLEEILVSRRGDNGISPEDSPAALKGLGLSRRETEVLWWAVEGKANKEIGMILGVSFRTVQKHIENIVRKLHVEHRHASVVHALRWLGRK